MLARNLGGAGPLATGSNGTEPDAVLAVPPETCNVTVLIASSLLFPDPQLAVLSCDEGPGIWPSTLPYYPFVASISAVISAADPDDRVTAALGLSGLAPPTS